MAPVRSLPFCMKPSPDNRTGGKERRMVRIGEKNRSLYTNHHITHKIRRLLS